MDRYHCSKHIYYEGSKPCPDCFPDVNIVTIKEIHFLLSLLSNEERLDVFREYCTACGTKQLPCYCRRDD